MAPEAVRTLPQGDKAGCALQLENTWHCSGVVTVTEPLGWASFRHPLRALAKSGTVTSRRGRTADSLHFSPCSSLPAGSCNSVYSAGPCSPPCVRRGCCRKVQWTSHVRLKLKPGRRCQVAVESLNMQHAFTQYVASGSSGEMPLLEGITARQPARDFFLGNIQLL